MPIYPHTSEGDRAERLHEYGITGAEETEWNSGFESSNVMAFRWVKDDPYPLQIWFWRRLPGGAKVPGPKYGYVAPESAYEELLFAPSKGVETYWNIRYEYPYLKIG